MRIIKVDATNSTNQMARELYPMGSSLKPICITAFEQTRGKGQRGAGWQSKPGENLTYSVLYPEVAVSVEEQFKLSASVAMAILDVLKSYDIPRVKVKWPNDIMAANKKLAGILIENILKNNKISASIIGVGLNVNQVQFENVPQAGSLKKLMGVAYNMDELLPELLTALEKRLEKLAQTTFQQVLEEYESHLFRKDMVSTFRSANGHIFSGIIRGVNKQGLLKVEVEENKPFKTFDLKEVKLLF